MEKENVMPSLLGKKVIVRGESSGVEYGTLEARDGREVALSHCRRLWYWDGACSLSQLAMDGTSKPGECKFTVYVDSMVVLDAIEVIPCTEKAIKSIEGVKVWKR